MKVQIIFTTLFLSISIYAGSSFAQTQKKMVTIPAGTTAAGTKGDFNSLLIKEINKRASYKEKFYVLPKSQKEKSESKASQYHKKARSLFEAGDSSLAQRYFEKAISLNPFVPLYSYELAICAYRNGSYMRSLALLELVKGPDFDSNEIQYYEALNNMKLNETDTAIKEFGYVIESKDESLAPSAAMYKGLLLKQKNELQEAKDAFQYVLDTTKDPVLDKKAEQQIDMIIAQERFEEEGKKKFSYSVYTGILYDSNVLNIANNNSSLDLKAYRLMYGGNLEYKAVYKPAHSFTPRLSASDLYSVDNSFDSNATIQSTDPLQAELALPYTYRFTMFKKGAALTLTPAYSQIYMSLNEASRELVYSTASLGTELSTSFWNKWINSYRLDVASDTFHPDTTAVNDQTAMKYGLTLNNTRLLDTTGSKTISLDLNYIKNDAEGINSLYDRIMGSVSGTYPAATKLISYGKLDYIHQDYSKSQTDRTDTGYIVTAGGIYNIKGNLSLNFYAQYYSNKSTVDLYDFNKFSVMTMISYSSGFF
ncbi:MAG: tetratricopeptide repeat protein [Bdellovibrionaceae bacterium]|nr:tetratricopeptide repeat protein [Pseudobdellovibrionaceae bacterium]